MTTLKHPVVIFIGGMLAGYMLSRVLDSVPFVKNLPKVRVG